MLKSSVTEEFECRSGNAKYSIDLRQDLLPVFPPGHIFDLPAHSRLPPLKLFDFCHNSEDLKKPRIVEITDHVFPRNSAPTPKEFEWIVVKYEPRTTRYAEPCASSPPPSPVAHPPPRTGPDSISNARRRTRYFVAITLFPTWRHPEHHGDFRAFTRQSDITSYLQDELSPSFGGVDDDSPPVPPRLTMKLLEELNLL